MTQPGNRLLYWAPRALGVCFAIFISLFALDVFGEGYSFWQTMLALFMHLIPTGLLAIALAIAWRWELAGALILIGLGLAFLAMTAASAGGMAWRANLVVPVPLLLTGGLFLADWLHRRARPHQSHE